MFKSAGDIGWICEILQGLLINKNETLHFTNILRNSLSLHSNIKERVLVCMPWSVLLTLCVCPCGDLCAHTGSDSAYNECVILFFSL